MSNNAERRLAIHYAKVRARCYGRAPAPTRALPPPSTPTAPQPGPWRPRAPLILPYFEFKVRHQWQSITVECADAHGVHLDLIFSREKTDRVVECRHEIWARCRAEIVMADGHQPSFTQIGRWFKKDHSTVIHGVKRYRTLHDQL